MMCIECIVGPESSKKTSNKELVTPHKIAVLLLIKQHCELKEQHNDRDTNDFNYVYTKRFCSVALKLIQTPDIDYCSLQKILMETDTNKKLSPALVESFKKQLDVLLKEGVGGLLDLISNTTKLIGSVKLCSRFSVLGLFMRRVHLNFNKLSFAQVVQLWEQFTAYISSEVKPEEHENLDLWTRKEIEVYFAREANRLINEEPSVLQAKVAMILKSHPDLAEAHFLSFLYCMKMKEFCGAKGSLHQCFDRISSFDMIEKSQSNNANGNNEEKNFRLGVLNLAAMHAHFGQKEEALQALKEVIRLAHNAGDSACLQHSLAWLYSLAKENKEALYQRAMARCSDLGLSYLMSVAIQAYTKYSAETGGRPSAVFDIILKSDALNSLNSEESDLANNSLTLKAGLWSLYGLNNMSTLYSQLLLRNVGSSCLDMCSVARVLADQGEFENAMTILNEAQRLFPRKECEAWMATYQEINFSQLVNHCKYLEAYESLKLLAPVNPRESKLRKTWFLHWIGNNVKAMDLAQATLQKNIEEWFSNTKLPPLHVRTLIVASECLNTGESLAYLLEALALTQTFSLHYLGAFITLHIANLQLNMGMARRAVHLVESILSHVMTHGGVQSRGRALLLLARCQINLPESSEDKPSLNSTLGVLTKAQNWLIKANDFIRVKHCWYLQAHIYNCLGLVAERNRCAYEFRQLEEHYLTPKAFLNSF